MMNIIASSLLPTADEASLAANSTAVVLAERELAMSTFMAESPQPTVATNQSHSAELVSEVRRLMESELNMTVSCCGLQ